MRAITNAHLQILTSRHKIWQHETKKNLHGQDSEEFLSGPSENFLLAVEGLGFSMSL